jgi:hypothetical protein
MDKEIGFGLSGLSALLLLVCLALLGLGMPITIGNVIFCLMIFAGSSITVGCVTFIVFIILFNLFRKENERNKV